jgi:hypothetical protein
MQYLRDGNRRLARVHTDAPFGEESSAAKGRRR